MKAIGRLTITIIRAFIFANHLASPKKRQALIKKQFADLEKRVWS